MPIYMSEIVVGEEGSGQISIAANEGISIVQMEDGVCPHTIIILTEEDARDLVRGVRAAAVINGWDV
jgi:hypothetical protein